MAEDALRASFKPDCRGRKADHVFSLGFPGLGLFACGKAGAQARKGDNGANRLECRIFSHDYALVQEPVACRSLTRETESARRAGERKDKRKRQIGRKKSVLSARQEENAFLRKGREGGEAAAKSDGEQETCRVR